MKNYTNITTFYVSQKNGNDLNTGFFKENRNFQGPLKTIEKALEGAAQIRKFGSFQHIEIVLLDDTYYTDKPIIIDESVSDVTITSENRTVISGGMRIESFSDDVFNGKACFSAEVSEIENGIWFTDLYVDNKRADLTHYPKSGKLTPLEVENNGIELFDSSKWFIARSEDVAVIKDFKNFNDCIISYYHFWVDEHTPIESYDLKSGKIVFKYPSRYTIEPTHPASALEYIIENVAEAFENKNEWYLDRQTKKVYYIPKNDEQTADNISVYAPLTDKLFIIKGSEDKKVEGIYFKNLAFAHTKGDYKSVYEVDGTECPAYASDSQAVSWGTGSIELEYAYNVSFENCIIKNTGLHGIVANKGCVKLRICDNDFYDLGGGAIKINGGSFGCKKCDETYGNFIHNNFITDSGNRYFSATGILIMHSYDNTVSNNTVSYQYYTGISVGWVWGYEDNITKGNIVEKNHIHHIGQGKLSDMGAVYLLGRQPGTIVRNNIIHDVESAHYGALGLYTDEGSSGIIFENNICYNIKGICFGQHFGNMNTIKNNIFVKSDEPPVALSKDEMHIGVLMEKNIIMTKNSPMYRIGYVNHPSANTHMISSQNNILFNENGNFYCLEIDGRKYDIEEAQKEFSLEEGSVFADPLFEDFENNNFNLKENSPALKLGFKNIDTDDVGAKR